MATILKTNSADVGRQPDALDQFNIQDVQDQAERIIAEAKLHADSILDQARTEAADLKEQARQQGLLAAETEVQNKVAEQAKALSDEKCSHALDSCENASRELQAATRQWLAGWRDETIEIAIQIARRLIQKEIASDQTELVRKWLQSAFDTIGKSSSARVCVHPEDLSQTLAAMKHLATRIPFAPEADLIADPSVQRGGCIVQTEHGRIDMQLETQLQRLAAELAGLESSP